MCVCVWGGGDVVCVCVCGEGGREKGCNVLPVPGK